MKKITLSLFLTLFIMLPINTFALGICEGNAKTCTFSLKTVTSSDAENSVETVSNGVKAITKKIYHIDTIDSPIFCVDAGNLNPKSVDKATEIDPTKALHKALLTIYRLYLVRCTANNSCAGSNNGGKNKLLVTANDAMRILVARGGSETLLSLDGRWWPTDSHEFYNDDLVKLYYDAGSQLSANSDYSYSVLKEPTITDDLRAFYCAGARVYGSGMLLSDSKTDKCKEALETLKNDVDVDNLKELLKKDITVDDILGLLTIDNLGISLVEDTTEVHKEGEPINFKLGGGGYKNWEKVFTAYPKLKNASSIEVTSCEVSESAKEAGFTCELVNENNEKNILKKDGIQQVKISSIDRIIKTETKVNATLSYKSVLPYSSTSLAVLECSGDDGCLNYGGRSNEENKDKYVDQRLLMVDSNWEDKSDIDISANVEPSCKMVLKEDGTPSYTVGNKEVTEKEYLEAGCCDVNPELLKENESKEHYKNFCMEEDFVHFENECGTKSIVDKQHITNQVASGSVSLTTCEVESYVDYTHSYIWQLPMERVMEKVNKLETSEAYKENTKGLYENTAIANNLDKCYMTSTVGSAGDQLVGIDIENNQYCMLYTSEEDDLYFPGTAVATSGRFFVFNELSMEECLNQANPGPNCFRQPYVEGKIYATMHTNYEKWERDYNKAIEEEIAAYDAWKASSSDTDKQTYELMKLQRETLEQYKTECEQRNDIQKYWNYNLAPTLDFRYKQRVYVNGNASEKEKLVEDTVAMSISSQAEKYWPFESTKPTVISGSISGSKSVKRFEIKYGDVNITKEFDQTTDYTVGFTQRLYYKPGKVTYATLPGGEYIIANDEYQATSPMFVNGGLEIGYVYNVRLTTYEGIYTTTFVIDKVGHTADSCTNNTSNIQKTLDKYKAEHKWEELDSECVYCNQESEYKRVCDQCPDPNEPPLEAAYVYRSIALNNVTPNDRSNTNWSDPKGSSAEARIEALSGDNIISALANDTKVKATILGDTETNAKVTNVARGYIYDDSTKDYLEYDFTLTTKDLQMIKKNNRRAEFDYGTINFCTTGNADATAKDADIDYCMKCNEYGKECTSTFIDAFSDMSITSTTRNSKWKYYVNNQWVLGSMKTIEELKDGYPDPLNPNAWLNISQDGKQPNNNWP